jgi:hypothetical protein
MMNCSRRAVDGVAWGNCSMIQLEPLYYSDFIVRNTIEVLWS